jgi:hypothetical protein
MVTMIDVKSSNLQAIGYDATQSRLYVQFKDMPRLYQYDGVPLIVWLGLEACESKGSYLHTQVIPYFSCRIVGKKDQILRIQ